MKTPHSLNILLFIGWVYLIYFIYNVEIFHDDVLLCLSSQLCIVSHVENICTREIGKCYNLGFSFLPGELLLKLCTSTHHFLRVSKNFQVVCQVFPFNVRGHIFCILVNQKNILKQTECRIRYEFNCKLDIKVIFKKDSIYLFLERGEGREKERERNMDAWELPLDRLPPTGDLARNPGMCSAWKSNQWPFTLQVGT